MGEKLEYNRNLSKSKAQDYNSDKTYDIDEFVKSNYGMLFVSLKGDNKNKPLTDTEYWEEVKSFKRLYIKDDNNDDVYKLRIQDGDLVIEKV